MSYAIALSLLISVSIDANNYHLTSILQSSYLQQQFSGFFDEVLRQIPSQQFYATVIPTIEHLTNPTDACIYAVLQEAHIVSPTPKRIYNALQALHHQKNVLTDQALQLLAGTTHIDTAVEIGTPATYINSLSKHIPINNRYTLLDKERLTDRLQAPSWNALRKFLAYNKCIPLNDYQPISDIIPNSSVDLVICYIGLHHIPIEKLHAFVASIARILKPGSAFILRDHDCENEQITSFAHAAHTVFNLLVANESLSTELHEVRNFQPMMHWITLLQEYGLLVGPERLRQKNDPSNNTLIIARKKSTRSEDVVQQVSHSLRSEPHYTRDLSQTFLTAPEWCNVDVAHDYGTYIHSTPFYEYPYFSSIGTYWKVFAESWKSAARRQGNWHVLRSPHTLMNLFVGATMTVELAAKGIIAAPLRWAYQGQEDLTIKMLISDPENQLGSISKAKLVTHLPGNLKLIEVPRYQEFLPTILEFNNTKIQIHEIAGQQEIQVKIRYNTQQKVNLHNIQGCREEYSWHLPSHPTQKYTALSVDIEQLQTLIQELQTRNIEILYIHDF